MENEFVVKQSLFDKHVLLRVAYSFIDDYYVYLDAKSDDEWIIKLKLKNNSPVKNLEKLEGEFRNALVNETFREALLTKTQAVKEMIVARALYGADNTQRANDMPDSNTVMQNKDFSYIEEEMDDYLEDPLGIAVPWEEKYKKETEDGV